MNETTAAALRDPAWWRRESNDLFFFEKVILSRAWPDKFHDFGPFQRQMCNFLTPALNPSKKKLLSAYRLSLKTTVLHGFICWLIAWYHYKKEPTSINYNTATEPNAVAFMEEVRQTLLNCDILQAAFGLPTTKDGYDSWTKKSIRIGHVKFMVSSFDEQQASRHAQIIINDDVVNEQNYRTEFAREETRRKWRFQKSVSSTIKNVKMNLEIDCGTPYHHDDLMWWLMRKNETYDKFIAAAISGWPNVGISDILNRTKPLTDPALMTYEILEDKIKEQEASIASSQYLLRPLAEEDAFCLPGWIHHWRHLPETTWRTFVTDPGGAIPGFHDASGFTILDADPEGQLYVVYAKQFWLGPTDLLKKIIELKAQYKPDDSRIEKDKYAMTIADTIEHRLPGLDVSFVRHQGRSKEDRIWKLRPILEKGRLLFGEGQDDLINQMLEYQPPQNKKDDLLDSLAYHLDIIRIPKKVDKPRFSPVIESTFDQEYDDYLKAVEARRHPEEFDAIF